MDLSSLAWPLAVVVIAIFAIHQLKAPLSDAIRRIKKMPYADFSSESPERRPAQQENSEPVKSTDEALAEISGTALLLENEQFITENIEAKGFQTEEEKIRYLTRLLANTHMFMDFEAINDVIFASQISLLRKINEFAPSGKELNEIEKIYDEIKEKVKPHLDEYSFDSYIGFLKKNSLAKKEGGQLIVTIKGREYLSWMGRFSKESGHLPY